MTQKDNDSITIPQEKLLDFFMHTATRQDVAELRSETHHQFSDVRQELTKLRIEIKQDIADLKAELKEDNARIEKCCDKLGQDLHDVFTHLSDKIDSNFKWTMGILIVSILSPIALHFVT